MTNIISINGTLLTSTTNGPLGGYTALGTSGSKLVVLTALNKVVVKLSPSDLKEMNLKALCGAKWCEHYYTEFDEKKEQMVFNHRRLANNIISDCQSKGTYVESYQRGTGVWLMKDGQLVINGSELWRADGTVLEHGIHEGRVYPAGGDVGFNRETPEASLGDVNRLLAAFGAPEWTHPLAAELLLGWYGMALVSTAVRRRPHVYVVGPAGCGKSTILDIMAWMLDPLAFACTGPQNLAGLSQGLSGTAKAAIVDELEAEFSMKSCKETFLASRMSYSLREGDKGIVRGSPNGTAKSYFFYSPFIAASVIPAKMEPADITRWILLEATGRKPGSFLMAESEAREIGPRLAQRFIKNWRVYQASEEAVRECILQSGGDGRMADTVGTLLASYWTFVSNTPATADDARLLVGMLDVKARVAVHAVSDESRCLEALMSKVLPFRFMEGISMVTRSLSIGEAVQRVCEDPTNNPEVVARLAQLGLRVVFAKGKWRLYVINSPEHQEIRKIFAGTKWAQGGWAMILRRLPGGEEATQRIGAGFGAAKVTVFDVPQDLLSANDEGDMQLAA